MPCNASTLVPSEGRLYPRSIDIFRRRRRRRRQPEVGLKTLIGASLSEPPTSEYNGGIFIFIYIKT